MPVGGKNWMPIDKQADVALRNAMDLAYLTGQRVADVLKMRETDIRDGALEVQQNKTGAKLRISVEGQLESVLRRCKAAKERHSVHSLSILTNETGQPLTKAMLRGRFEKARKAAAGTGSTEVARSSLLGIQFRDLRAKAATDKTDNAGDIRQAQKQLGHTTVGMTENYVRSRRGEKVKPTK